MTDLRHIPLEELLAEIHRRQGVRLKKLVDEVIKREIAEEEDDEAIIADRINKTFAKPEVV